MTDTTQTPQIFDTITIEGQPITAGFVYAYQTPRGIEYSDQIHHRIKRYLVAKTEPDCKLLYRIWIKPKVKA